MPATAELLIQSEFDLYEKSVLKIKRAGPSHKPHPKATCPHPTRPLRPPGRRAPDDYAQVTRKMQPKVLCFFGAFCRVKSQLDDASYGRSTRDLRGLTPTQYYATR